MEEKIEIVHEVLCKLNPLKMVAKKHRVSQSWIWNIVRKVKKQPNLLSELIAVREEKKQLNEKVSESIIDMYNQDEHFSSIQLLQSQLKDQY